MTIEPETVEISVIANVIPQNFNIYMIIDKMKPILLITLNLLKKLLEALSLTLAIPIKVLTAYLGYGLRSEITISAFRRSTM